jgi:GNAT superfamily N-acetyltransferase
MARPRLRFQPLVPRLLPDLERLFGPRGACAGCWCAWWKTTRAGFEAGRGEGNREAMRRQVRAGVVPGILAYAGSEPVGWCALEPRSAYSRLARSRTLAPVDEVPVWSVTCFFVARGWRRRGLTRALLRAAVAHARAAGAPALEGYPVDARGPTADAWLYTGLLPTFLGQGFEEVARRSATRPVVRRTLSRRRAPAAPRRGPARSRPGSSPSRRSPPRRGR